MAVHITVLINHRGVIKGRITRFVKFLSELQQKEYTEQIRVRKNKIENIWDEFQKKQSTIEAKVANERAVAVEKSYRFEFVDQYFQAIAESEKALAKKQSESTPKYIR